MSTDIIKSSSELIELAYSVTPETRRAVLKEIMLFVILSYKQGDLKELSNFLLNLDPCKTMEIVSTGILRITYSHSDKIENWSLFRAKVISHLQSNRLNWQHQLRGLLGDEQVNQNPFASEFDKLAGIHPTLCR